MAGMKKLYPEARTEKQHQDKNPLKHQKDADATFPPLAQKVSCFISSFPLIGFSTKILMSLPHKNQSCASTKSLYGLLLHPLEKHNEIAKNPHKNWSLKSVIRH